MDAWIDWNHNGSWLDAGDQVFANESLTAGTNHLLLLVPPLR